MNTMARSVRPVRLVMLLAAVAFLVTVFAGCDPARESDFANQINQLRRSKGLPALTVQIDLTNIAHTWTDQMVNAGHLSHNPYLASEAPGGWRKLGENVGVGPDVSSLMRAFINSPAHYANLVDPAYNFVGIGVSYAPNGQMYVTQDFMSA